MTNIRKFNIRKFVCGPLIWALVESGVGGEEKIVKRVGAMHLVILAVTTAILAVLDAFAVIALPAVPGVSSLYLACAAQYAFAMWFGCWAIPAAWIGGVLGGIITGMPLLVAMIMKIPNFLGVVPTAIFFKIFKLNPALKRLRDWVGYLVLVTAGGIYSGFLGVWLLTILFYVPPEVAYTLALFSWIVGGEIVLTVILAPILLIVSPFVMRTRLYIEGLFV